MTTPTIEDRLDSVETALKDLRSTFERHISNESSALGRLRAAIESEQASRDKTHDAEMRLMRFMVGASLTLSAISLAGFVTLAVVLLLKVTGSV